MPNLPEGLPEFVSTSIVPHLYTVEGFLLAVFANVRLIGAKRNPSPKNSAACWHPCSETAAGQSPPISTIPVAGNSETDVPTIMPAARVA